MTMFITIHKAKEEEVAAIKELLYDSWVDTYKNIYSQQTINKVTSIWHSINALLSQLTNPAVHFAVAKDTDEKIIGIVTAYKDNNIMRLTRLYIHPMYQRRGVGKKLFEHVYDTFKDCKKIVLEVEKDNPKGMTFYKKHGFVEKEVKQDTVGGEIVTCLIMEKGLV